MYKGDEESFRRQEVHICGIAVVVLGVVVVVVLLVKNRQDSSLTLVPTEQPSQAPSLTPSVEPTSSPTLEVVAISRENLKELVDQYVKDTRDGNDPGSTTFTINQPDSISVGVNTTQATCGGMDGTATLTLSGAGTGTLTPNWNGENPNALSPGAYPVIITDASGCDKTEIVQISSPNAPSISVVSTDVTCYGESTGTATETAVGVNGSSTIDWGGATPTALSVFCNCVG